MKKKMITVRLDDFLHEELLAAAADRNLNPTALIREFIRNGISSVNAVATFISEENTAIQKTLARIESVAFANAYFSIVVAGKQEVSQFDLVISKGRRLADEAAQKDSKAGE